MIDVVETFKEVLYKNNALKKEQENLTNLP